MKSLIIDCSISLAWVLSDQSTLETDRILDSLGEGAMAFVPAFWPWEIANALSALERHARVTRAEMNRHLSLFRALPIVVDEASVDQVWTGARLLADKHLLMVYDAAYLELAIRRGLPLASLNSDLRLAATAEKVQLVSAGG